MATHSSILGWEIPWIEEPGGLLSTVSQSRTPLSEHTCMSWRWETSPCLSSRLAV